MEGRCPGASAAGPGRCSGALVGFRLRTQLLVAVGRCPVNGVLREGDGDRRVAAARFTAVAEGDEIVDWWSVSQ
jgi:hypothetical protein